MPQEKVLQCLLLDTVIIDKRAEKQRLMLAGQEPALLNFLPRQLMLYCSKLACLPIPPKSYICELTVRAGVGAVRVG